MQRLPSYDRSTRFSEMAAFVGLGIAGLLLIALAGSSAARFAENRQGIIAALKTNDTAELFAGSQSVSNHTSTNLIGPQHERETGGLPAITRGRITSPQS